MRAKPTKKAPKAASVPMRIVSPIPFTSCHGMPGEKSCAWTFKDSLLYFWKNEKTYCVHFSQGRAGKTCEIFVNSLASPGKVKYNYGQSMARKEKV
jgi:hypothetical protein